MITPEEHADILAQALAAQGTTVRQFADDLPPARAGLEGPFRFASGEVLFYDPVEGSYYDGGSDMYVSPPSDC
jgi:hypothetical protein